MDDVKQNYKIGYKKVGEEFVGQTSDSPEDGALLLSLPQEILIPRSVGLVLVIQIVWSYVAQCLHQSKSLYILSDLSYTMQLSGCEVGLTCKQENGTHMVSRLMLLMTGTGKPTGQSLGRYTGIHITQRH
ncbi:hypothetical protein CHARACLAT_032272 [Characodon lateralis]|uniref:Uncharacterized protein n=1 Tax=Characodon lateralis TaxID=208331 RepID=A0ABU7EPT9_9TELE|nr:hypothetical protein [Characodon lateralis]